MKPILSATLILLMTVMTGCGNSSKTITDHFDNLTSIAKSYGNDCENMSNALNEYLVENETSLKDAVSNVRQATPEEAAAIYNSSEELHTSTVHCQNTGLENFRKHLSELVLREAVNQ